MLRFLTIPRKEKGKRKGSVLSVMYVCVYIFRRRRISATFVTKCTSWAKVGQRMQPSLPLLPLPWYLLLPAFINVLYNVDRCNVERWRASVCVCICVCMEGGRGNRSTVGREQSQFRQTTHLLPEPLSLRGGHKLFIRRRKSCINVRPNLFLLVKKLLTSPAGGCCRAPPFALPATDPSQGMVLRIGNLTRFCQRG